MDVVIDTDILSTFIKVGKTGLLHKLFPKSKILLCPAVNSEISRAKRLGILDTMPSTFSNGELTQSEKSIAKEIAGRTALGSADIECLSVAKSRNCLILGNDRQVGNEALSLGVDHLSLPLALRELWKTGLLSKKEVTKLIDEIERKDRIAVKNKGLIFK
jgi:predicted nucleic acid-binding protein